MVPAGHPVRSCRCYLGCSSRGWNCEHFPARVSTQKALYIEGTSVSKLGMVQGYVGAAGSAPIQCMYHQSRGSWCCALQGDMWPS